MRAAHDPHRRAEHGRAGAAVLRRRLTSPVSRLALMKIVGVGLDLVKIARIRALVERWQERILTRLYTEEERRYCLGRAAPYASLAGRFAAKEAILKALGTGLAQGARWVDIQVLNDPAGRPVATVRGPLAERIREAGVTGIHVSLSHDGDYAIAEALLTAMDR